MYILKLSLAYNKNVERKRTKTIKLKKTQKTKKAKKTRKTKRIYQKIRKKKQE